MDLNKALLLDPHLFTPQTRTPWAGERIAQTYKSDVMRSSDKLLIGESWEFSCDESFPSRLLDAQEVTVIDLVKKFPKQVLGNRLAQQFYNSATGCDILVKLINAAMPLSVQVHPDDSFSQLKPCECGKPESWYILDVEPGAGLYIGLNRELSRQELRTILQQPGDRAQEYLQFIEVKPGEYFDLTPGVIHAIGAGVTLLEVQRVLFLHQGKTLRLWDWGRRYNVQGEPDPQGQPRELHLDMALSILEPSQQVGKRFLASLRKEPLVKNYYDGGLEISIYPPGSGYQLNLIKSFEPGLELQLQADTYGILTGLQGRAHLRAQQAIDQPVDVCQGYTALLPQVSLPQVMRFDQAGQWALILPSQAKWQLTS